MKLKILIPSPSEYFKTKEEHGENHIRVNNENIARMNGLHLSDTYRRLSLIQKAVGHYYVVAVLDERGQCFRVGHTESPFDYWTNLLSNDTVTQPIADVVVLERGLERKAAHRRRRELDGEKLQVTRRLRIARLLAYE
ncbi:hypothetical protein ACD591_10070 [Rufibacter glacialis]|uniref:GIY-YIG nuclease family protein n=1 Tax=Rufibacter glacialis TaxID=1259555 RepID=A0A5M8QAB0_9BACT|nr:hypothetical protein [Rufibacter glacialis]KAA6431884.1 hypothetical protein FOE74_17405 [Rufibacter glacialis]GGK80706.1 hypothetical protein GCM10011405_30600 [Rufibacter glacialis]